MSGVVYCLKALTICSRVFLRTCGVGLLLFFLGMTYIVCESFVSEVLSYYYKNNSFILYFLGSVPFFFFTFNAVFNYLSATFRSSGTTRDYEHLLHNIQDGFNTNYCSDCELPKPGNAHHCSFCNRCVIDLDHHCPWINNCVGFNNYRFFLLFLTYTCLTCQTYTMFNIPVILNLSGGIFTLPVRALLSSLMCLTLSIVLLLFALWSWYLALSNQTYIAIIKSKNAENNTYTTKSILWDREFLKTRIRHIFGTDNLVYAFLPANRTLNLGMVNPEESVELVC